MAEEQPAYKGQSKMIHVLPDSFTVLPEGPENERAVYLGQSPAIAPNIGSPAHLDDSTIRQVGFHGNMYTGRSQAIHVFGDDFATFDPPTPIPSCKCCEEGVVLVPTESFPFPWTDWRGETVLTASELGGETSIDSGPTFNNLSATSALWSNWDSVSGHSGSFGQFEKERRCWQTWLVPPETSHVRIFGTIKVNPIVGVPTLHDGVPVTVLTRYELGMVVFDPDVSPDWGLIGTDHSGEFDYTVVDHIGEVGEEHTIDFIANSFGPAYDSGGAVDPDWKTVQFSLRVTSETGVGRHTKAGGPGGDFDLVEEVPRFPNNPDWHLGTPDYRDTSEVESVVFIDLEMESFTGGVEEGGEVARGDCVDPPGTPHNVWDSMDDRETFGANPSELGVASSDGTDWAAFNPVSGNQLVYPSNAYAYVASDEMVLVNAYGLGNLRTGANNDAAPAVGSVDWEMLIRFKFDERPDDPASIAQLFVYIRPSGSPSKTDRIGQIVLSENPDPSSPFYCAPGTWHQVRYQHSVTDRTDKWRIWPESSPEPSTWHATYNYPVGISTTITDFSIVLEGLKSFGATEILPATVHIDWIDFNPEVGGGADCDACEDPANPGFPLPPFTPGYLPTFRRQIGDPTTWLDSYICTLESAAMVLDWHTRGEVKVWGGELIPFTGRTEGSIFGTGTNLGDAKRAWLNGWGQHLENRTGQSWNSLMNCLAEGRAVILQGDYGEFTLNERCQDSFEDNHAVAVFPYQVGDRLLVGDPICSNFKNFRISSLQAYAEALGAAEFGAQSPQPIFFAVSRPWVP